MGKKCVNINGVLSDIDNFKVQKQSNDNSQQLQVVIKMIRRVTQNELTEKQRQAFEYVYYNNLSVTNTAQLMGISQSACSRLLKRGREKIRNILSYGYFPIWQSCD